MQLRPIVDAYVTIVGILRASWRVAKLRCACRVEVFKGATERYYLRVFVELSDQSAEPTYSTFQSIPAARERDRDSCLTSPACFTRHRIVASPPRDKTNNSIRNLSKPDAACQKPPSASRHASTLTRCSPSADRKGDRDQEHGGLHQSGAYAPALHGTFEGRYLRTRTRVKLSTVNASATNFLTDV